MGYFRNGCKRPSGSRDYYYGKEKDFREYYKQYYVLHLHIKQASNVDQLVGAFVPTRNPWGHYQVMVSESQDEKQYKTRIVKGKPEPCWGSDMEIEFDEFPEGESLFLEVLELRSTRDPGTSAGVVVVGRAQIPVPTKPGDFGWRRQELVTLMGSEKKIAGFIFLHMKLEVISTKTKKKKLEVMALRRNPTRRHMDGL